MVDHNSLEETNANTVIQVDSLSANEFAVEIDGQVANGIFRVVNFMPFNAHADSVRSVLITKMVQRDASNPFNRWLRESMEGEIQPRRTVSIVAIDDQVEIRRWELKNAWIMSVGYSDFNTSNVELVEEQVTIAYESVVVKWS
ncbi:MAG: phage tail protein [Anaerolineae bacterium]|jgi:hypothetical protein|nr:phage tail protein [Anaerolineae bacterium]